MVGGETLQTTQFMITPASGKRLIAKALINYAPVQSALESGTLVIIANHQWLLGRGNIIQHRPTGRFFQGEIFQGHCTHHIPTQN